MGEAKRRKAEILELKKKPHERKRVKRALGKAKTEQVYHFRSEAARRAANIDEPLRNSDEVTRAVKLGNIEQQFVQAIPLKILTPVEIEPTRPPRVPQPFPIAVGCKGEELAHLVAAMANISPNGKGFRQPSAKEKNWQSTSLVEQLSIKWLGASPHEFKRSERGEKKLQARNETKALALLDSVIEQWPDRAQRAKNDERMLNWIVAKVEETYAGDTDAAWRDWLRIEAKTRLNGRHPKFWHAAQRRRAEQEEVEIAA